jgi:hypothetical protein
MCKRCGLCAVERSVGVQVGSSSSHAPAFVVLCVCAHKKSSCPQTKGMFAMQVYLFLITFYSKLGIIKIFMLHLPEMSN